MLYDNNGNFYDEKGNYYMVRCPECGRENYAPSVASGVCAWCSYNGNTKNMQKKPKKPNKTI
jgi:ribosomal protein L37E